MFMDQKIAKTKKIAQDSAWNCSIKASFRQFNFSVAPETAKMPRRNRIILEQRERIIQAFENTNEDYLMVADTIGVNRSTARSIVARYVREGRIAERLRGGPNTV